MNKLSGVLLALGLLALALVQTASLCPPCDPATCGGCCQDGECLALELQDNNTCGSDGDECVACSTDQKCQDGQCVAKACSGVCDGGSGGSCGCRVPDGGTVGQPYPAGTTFTVVSGCIGWNDATQCSGWHSVLQASGSDTEALYPDRTIKSGTFGSDTCQIQIHCP